MGNPTYGNFKFGKEHGFSKSCFKSGGTVKQCYARGGTTKPVGKKTQSIPEPTMPVATSKAGFAKGGHAKGKTLVQFYAGGGKVKGGHRTQVPHGQRKPFFGGGAALPDSPVKAKRTDVHEGKVEHPGSLRSGNYKGSLPGAARGGHWIQGAIKHPGALHRQLGVPQGQKIPKAKLAAAAGKGGVLGKRARLAETLGKMHKARGGKVGFKDHEDSDEGSEKFEAARGGSTNKFEACDGGRAYAGGGMIRPPNPMTPLGHAHRVMHRPMAGRMGRPQVGVPALPSAPMIGPGAGAQRPMPIGRPPMGGMPGQPPMAMKEGGHVKR